MAKTANSPLEKKGAIVRAMDAVERVGNALPNPATIFLILTVAVIIISAICGSLGVSVTYETIDTANGNAIVEKTVKAVNLLTPDSIRHLVTTVVSSFTGFFALGTVFTIMIGVGVADGSGMISAMLRRAANSAPKTLVTAMVVFLGIMSNIASSTGYVVLVPLGAILFMAFGRHPIAGLAAAFAGVSGGWRQPPHRHQRPHVCRYVHPGGPDPEPQLHGHPGLQLVLHVYFHLSGHRHRHLCHRQAG